MGIGGSPDDIIIITTNSGKELFTLDDGKEEVSSMTAAQLYKTGTQWFEPTADNYVPLKSVSPELTSMSELKHFTWVDIVDFAEVDRWNGAYATGGSGDWKSSPKGADGYLLAEVEGIPYWSDALGQIPFAVDQTKGYLLRGQSKENAIMKTLLTGQKYGDGSLFGGTSDFSNTYDNAMIKRAATWTTQKYTGKLISSYTSAREGTTTKRYNLISNGLSPRQLKF